MIKSVFISLITCISAVFLYQPSAEAIQGKIDVGPAWASIDLLKSGKTEETRNLLAIRGDATIVIKDGYFVKPTFILGWREAKLAAGSIGVGYAVPVKDRLVLFPQVGYTWTYLHTDIDIEPLALSGVRERFRSRGPFIGCDFTYKLFDCLTLMGSYQYAWSQTHTEIKPIIDEISHSSGPNYSIGLDYRFAPQWSVTLGAAYNISLSREKHGIRGKGVKVGLAYYF